MQDCPSLLIADILIEHEGSGKAFIGTKILEAIQADPHKFLPEEVFGPSLKDILETVAKIKGLEKENEKLKKQLAEQEEEFNQATIMWMEAVHDERTELLNALDRANSAEVQAAGLQVEIDAMHQDQDNLLVGLNAVCDEFCIDVQESYADGFRTALGTLLKQRNNRISERGDEEKAHAQTAQLLVNARIDNNQLRTELRHAEGRYTVAEKELESLNNDYRCMKNQRDDIMKISDDDAVKLMKERDAAKVELSEYANKVIRAVEGGFGGLWFVTSDKLLNSLTLNIRELKTQRDEAVRVADKMRPELAHLRNVVGTEDKNLREIKEAAFAREEALIDGMHKLMEEHTESIHRFARQGMPRGQAGVL